MNVSTANCVNIVPAIAGNANVFNSLLIILLVWLHYWWFCIDYKNLKYRAVRLVGLVRDLLLNYAHNHHLRGGGVFNQSIKNLLSNKTIANHDFFIVLCKNFALPQPTGWSTAQLQTNEPHPRKQWQVTLCNLLDCCRNRTLPSQIYIRFLPQGVL